MRVVVIGNGMVGHRFVELAKSCDVTTFCEEPRLAYDRVNLSSYFAGKSAAELALARVEEYRRAGVVVHVGDKAVAIDRAGKTVTSQAGLTVAYDKLVLATGSYPFVPPIRGSESRGCFVYRTIEDLDAIRDAAAHGARGRGHRRRPARPRGGQRAQAPRPRRARRRVRAAPDERCRSTRSAARFCARASSGSASPCTRASRPARSSTTTTGASSALQFADGSELAADLVVFSAGIRPRDELARACGLAIGDRGGIVIDDRCRTSDPDIFAIGECALHGGRTYGLVAPGYHMARRRRRRARRRRLRALHRRRHRAPSSSCSASTSPASATRSPRTPGARLVSFFDGNAEVYKKLVVSADGKRLLGGILVGDAGGYGAAPCSSRRTRAWRCRRIPKS